MGWGKETSAQARKEAREGERRAVSWAPAAIAGPRRTRGVSRVLQRCSGGCKLGGGAGAQVC